MADISPVRKNENELSELQAEFGRKKKKIVDQENREITDLRENYVERKEGVIEQNDAAINHIRKSAEQDVETAQTERVKTQERAQRQSGKIEELYKKKIADMHANTEGTLKNARDKLYKKVSELESDQNEKMVHLKQENDQIYHERKTEGDAEIHSLTERYDQHKKAITAENQQAMTLESQEGQRELKRVHDDNQKEVLNAHVQSNEVIDRTKKVEETKYNRLEADSKKHFDHDKKNWESRETKLDTEYTGKLNNKHEAYDSQLKTQKKHFDTLYTKNEEANRQSAQIQRANASKELNEIKRNFLRDANKYEGKENDPFYKVQDRGSKIDETHHFYVIDAYVPAHEKDDIKVIVEKNRAVIQGNREFQDKFQDDEGKKVATSSFQSFREEFPFDKPVMTEGMSRERNGDWVRIIVPKLTSYSKKA